MKCKFCEQDINEGAVLCDWCGRRQEEAAPGGPIPPQAAPPTVYDPLAPRVSTWRKPVKVNPGEVIKGDVLLLIIVILMGLFAALSLVGLLLQSATGSFSLPGTIITILALLAFIGVLQLKVWGFWIVVICGTLFDLYGIYGIAKITSAGPQLSQMLGSNTVPSGLGPVLLQAVGTAIVFILVILGINTGVVVAIWARKEKFS